MIVPVPSFDSFEVRQSVQHGVVVTVGKGREVHEAHARKNEELAREARKRGDRKAAEKYESIAKTTRQLIPYFEERERAAKQGREAKKQVDLLKAKLAEAKAQGKFLTPEIIARINKLSETDPKAAMAELKKYNDAAASLGSVKIDLRGYKNESAAISVLKEVTGLSEDEIRKALPVGYGIHNQIVSIGVNKYGAIYITGSADTKSYEKKKQEAIKEMEREAIDRYRKLIDSYKEEGDIEKAMLLERSLDKAIAAKKTGDERTLSAIMAEMRRKENALKASEEAKEKAKNISPGVIVEKFVPPAAAPPKEAPAEVKAEVAKPAVSTWLMLGGLIAIGAVSYLVFARKE